MARQNRSKAGPMAGIVGLVIIMAMVYLVFKMISGVFGLLSMMAIPLFIIALFLNYRVVSDYFNWVVSNIKKEPAKGLVIAGASVIGYPVVAAWLAFKAYTTKKLGKVKNSKKKEDGEYLKYEEVEKESEDFLELDDLDKPKTRQKVRQTQNKTKDNDYEDLFS